MSPIDFFHAHPGILAASLDLIPQEVVYIDPDFTILWMNKAKERSHPDLAPGMKCWEAFNNASGQSGPCDFCLASQAESLGSNIKNPVCLLTGKHRNIPRHINIMISPVAFKDDLITGFIEVVDNMEALYQSNSELERLNREYESVIYALSHDLRAPLISIEGFLRKMKKTLEPGDSGLPAADSRQTVSHCMDRIHANTETMNGLVSVLLDTSRIITGALDRGEVNMEEIARKTSDQFQVQAAEQGARITVTGDFSVEECDRVRVMQVYSNLVNNALVHCRNTPDLVIELGAKDHVYWVKDNGPGVPPDFQEKIFEPFSQAGSTGVHGFGMGMNIVFRIIQKHGGEIWIESHPGKGTAIFFSFKPEVE